MKDFNRRGNMGCRKPPPFDNEPDHGLRDPAIIRNAWLTLLRGGCHPNQPPFSILAVAPAR
ncbi:MAG: hypothetical protein R2867_15210 [Caldilineaceae bacterium]